MQARGEGSIVPDLFQLMTSHPSRTLVLVTWHRTGLRPCYPVVLFRLRPPEEYGNTNFLDTNRLVRLGFILVENHSLDTYGGKYIPGFRAKLVLLPPEGLAAHM